jgi:molybdopterin synthase sulfur carrier subunit
MKISVRYFASLREALGASESVEVPDNATLGDIRQQLVVRGGRHAELLAAHRPVRCALNQSLANESAIVGEGDEVAFFPPVTGG